jgi:hypothetical protein
MKLRLLTGRVVTMQARERARRRRFRRVLPEPPTRSWLPVEGIRETVGSFAVFAPLALALRALVVSHFDYSVAESLIVYTGSLPYIAVTLVGMVPAFLYATALVMAYRTGRMRRRRPSSVGVNLVAIIALTVPQVLASAVGYAAAEVAVILLAGTAGRFEWLDPPWERTLLATAFVVYFAVVVLPDNMWIPAESVVVAGRPETVYVLAEDDGSVGVFRPAFGAVQRFSPTDLVGRDFCAPGGRMSVGERVMGRVERGMPRCPCPAPAAPVQQQPQPACAQESAGHHVRRKMHAQGEPSETDHEDQRAHHADGDAPPHRGAGLHENQCQGSVRVKRADGVTARESLPGTTAHRGVDDRAHPPDRRLERQLPRPPAEGGACDQERRAKPLSGQQRARGDQRRCPHRRPITQVTDPLERGDQRISAGNQIVRRFHGGPIEVDEEYPPAPDQHHQDGETGRCGEDDRGPGKHAGRAVHGLESYPSRTAGGRSFLPRCSRSGGFARVRSGAPSPISRVCGSTVRIRTPAAPT